MKLKVPEIRCSRGHLIKTNSDLDNDAMDQAKEKARSKGRRVLKREPTELELMDYLPALKRRAPASRIACEECARSVDVPTSGVALSGEQESNPDWLGK